MDGRCDVSRDDGNCESDAGTRISGSGECVGRLTACRFAFRCGRAYELITQHSLTILGECAVALPSITGGRVDPELVEAAARKHGLTGASPSFLVRYALALMAGVETPATVAAVRRGRPPMRREATSA